MKRHLFFLGLLAPLLLGGCFSFTLFESKAGVQSLGSHRLEDGRRIEFIQVKTSGHSGPDVSAVEGWLYDPKTNTTEKVSAYSGTAPGLAESAFNNSVAGAMVGGGIAGAGAATRPPRTITNVEQTANPWQFQYQGW